MSERSRARSIGSRVKDYRRRATCQGINVELSDEQFVTLFHCPCTYCGSGEKLNGLDRINPFGGYTMDNVLPACAPCNYMKGTLRVEEFLDRAKTIASRQEHILTVMMSGSMQRTNSAMAMKKVFGDENS